MSLGWQTESALLPSKAKPIKVDDKSMLGLKTMLYSAEQNSYASKINRNIQIAKASKPTQPVESQNSSSEKNDAEAKRIAALKVKAKIYEEMESGKSTLKSDLVNFETNPPPKIVIQSQKSVGICGNSQYAWSNGAAHAEVDGSKDVLLQAYQNKISESKELRNTVDNEMASLLGENSDDRVVSSGARIKTQWEKALGNSARHYLDEVHEEVNNIKVQSESHTGEAGNLKRSAKEERLELIRQKRARMNEK